MNFKPVEIVHVKYHRGDEVLALGRLASSNRKIFFEYDKNFLRSGLELSPFKLPLKIGVSTFSEGRVFDGLFGIFNDSLPDGWGRLLLDRKLVKAGINLNQITALDRLCYVGKNGMGALTYEPEIADFFTSEHFKGLNKISEECAQFLENDDDKFIDDLLAMSGSSAGARPKILVSILSKKKPLEFTTSSFETDNNWIIKFHSHTDHKEAGSIEYAYNLMAKKAGLDVPETRLFDSRKFGKCFAVKRFDRQKSSFLHMHTVAGLLHIDHNSSHINFDYEQLLKVTLHLTCDMRQCEKQFRHMLFNILSHNRDDHTKNFSFLMDKNGKWQVSPAYDLTYSSGPQGEHHATVFGEGKNPTKSHVLKLAEIVSIKPKIALEIIDEVKLGISKWSSFAQKAEMSVKTSKNIKVILDKNLKNF